MQAQRFIFKNLLTHLVSVELSFVALPTLGKTTATQEQPSAPEPLV